MKKLYPALGAVLAALLLTACQMPGALGVGSLQIAVPVPAGLRAATTSGQGNLIRIQLVRNGVVVPLGGQNILQQGLAGQTITVNGLATGTNYKIYAASGSMNANGTGFFETSYYAASDPFEISAGTSTSVSVTLNPTPISIIEDGGTSVNHAAVSYNNALYFIDGADFKFVTGADPAPAATLSTQIAGFLSSAGAATGTKVYSVSFNGYSSFWFNTSQGILPFDATEVGGLFQNVSTGTGTASLAVWQSGTVTLTGGSALAFYYGPGLTVGLAPAANYGNAPFSSGVPTWTTLTSMLSLSPGSTLETALNKLNQAVSGVATDAANYVYISTGIGAYRLDSSLLGQGTSQLGIDLTNGNDGNGNSILLATEDGSLIGPVSTYSDTSSKAFAFAGTTKGLYAAAVAPASGIPSGDGKLQLLTETSGLNITGLQTLPHLASSSTNGPNTAYTVAYSATTNEVLIYNDLSLVTRLSALAGLPSGTLNFTWHLYNNGSGREYLLLVIAGSDATVEYPVNSWTYSPPPP